jgi:hypothetical protein|tara:strand:- start:559 stop:810 length:252 start_codon:yes stop_codon:yes gene_type:complete
MYILSDTEEILVAIIGMALVLGILIKSYKDYKSMTAEYKLEIKKKEQDEKYVQNLIQELDDKNELLKKASKLIKKINQNDLNT